ncbi:MAG: response regulator [Candidatus Zixiibacteriota bacterium]
MADAPCILIADDEEVFYESTADLLRREGYECDCAPDGPTAAAMIHGDRYDLLIADIRMPGNPGLELVDEVARTVPGLPVILVTGYPSMQSAVQSLNLPVWAYLFKPLDFDDLLPRVRAAVQYHQRYRLIRHSQRRLHDWLDNMDVVESVMLKSTGDATRVPVSAFAVLTLRNIGAALSDLQQIIDSLTEAAGDADACHLFDCPRPAALRAALKETVSVLERTKRSFKSRELGELRARLERLLAQEGA